MLMLECPAAYNDICGGDYARVHRVSDGEPIVQGVLKTTVVSIGRDDDPVFPLYQHEEEGFPWCDACKSYHHAKNPTCIASET